MHMNCWRARRRRESSCSCHRRTRIRLALHRGAGRTAVPVRSALASATVGVAGLCAAIVFAASLSHLLASPALYG
jgi:hypothetical protein